MGTAVGSWSLLGDFGHKKTTRWGGQRAALAASYRYFADPISALNCFPSLVS